MSKTERGLHFKVPADWPVEERNGIVSPVPIEEYLSRKFSAITSRFNVLEERVNTLEKRLRASEKETQRLKESLQALQKPKEGS